MKRIVFKPGDVKDLIEIHNTDEEHIGYLERMRIGAWMSWCLLLKDDCYLSKLKMAE